MRLAISRAVASESEKCLTKKSEAPSLDEDGAPPEVAAGLVNTGRRDDGGGVSDILTAAGLRKVARTYSTLRILNFESVQSVPDRICSR
jgi:hypothetical protein